MASPVEDNFCGGRDCCRRSATRAGQRGEEAARPAAVILPDYAARVTVLDFDSFPTVAEEQLSLVRFRVKKTIPFDIDSAAVSYFRADRRRDSKKVEVLAVTMALEVIARYEALFRSAGFHPGVVTTSTLAALNLYRKTGEGVAVLAKLSGQVLTVDGDCGRHDQAVPLRDARRFERRGDSGGSAPDLRLCGRRAERAGAETDSVRIPARTSRRGCSAKAKPCGSRFGTPGPFNAGLLGYLE